MSSHQNAEPNIRVHRAIMASAGVRSRRDLFEDKGHKTVEETTPPPTEDDTPVRDNDPSGALDIPKTG